MTLGSQVRSRRLDLKARLGTEAMLSGDKVLLVLLQKSGDAGQVEDRQRLGGYPTRQKPEKERLPRRRSQRDAARPSV